MTSSKVPPQLPNRTPCKLAFVGEAPSDEEVIAKQPFVGPSGRVFNAVLRSANLEREEFLITNVFDEQAPDNDLDKAGWFKDTARIEENFARLNEELENARPNVIVPLGATALWAFTGERKISPYRGAVSAATRIRTGAKLLPTFHPTAVIQQWKILPIVTGDFVKAAKEAELGPKIVYPKRTLLIEPTLADVTDFLSECHKSDLLSVDIETGWGQITAISFAPNAEIAMSIPFVDLRKPDRNYWRTTDEEMLVWKTIKELCESPVPKLGQNFMYDVIWMWEKRRIAMRNYRQDTRLRHKVLYPELPADLGSMGATYTRIGVWKNWSGGYQSEVKKDG